MRQIEDEDWKPDTLRQLEALEDRKPEEGALVAYLYDPRNKMGGQVLERGHRYTAMVGGNTFTLTDPEGAIEAAWLMIERRSPLSPPVPVRRKGGAA